MQHFPILIKRVFGCAVEKIDFDRIDFVELILVKSELNIKWFMFGYLQNKSDLYEKCCLDVLSQNCF